MLPAGMRSSEVCGPENAWKAGSYEPRLFKSSLACCSAFTVLDECLAALHASHNLSLNFTCLSAAMTGVHTGADVSSCKVADGEKALLLNKAIHALNPGADAKGAAKNAEQQAKDDLNNLGS